MRHGTHDPEKARHLLTYSFLEMGILPREWEDFRESEIEALLTIHNEVKKLEDEKWDARIKAILSALTGKRVR